jgi:hypothetical protein
MSMQGDQDPTAPVPGAGERFPGSDPTQPVTRPEYGGPGEPPPGGGGGDWDDEDEGNNRRLLMIAGGVLVAGLIVGGAIAVLAGGNGDETTDTTTTSSSSTSTSTSTTSTSSTLPPSTSPAGPQILQYTVNQNPVNCPNDNSTVQIVLTWSTQNAQSATISIDNPNGPFGTYGPSGQQQVPFACSANPPNHTYYLTANGSGGQRTTRQIDVIGNVAATTTSSTGP